MQQDSIDLTYLKVTCMLNQDLKLNIVKDSLT